jgi:hypothetical protein
MMTWGQGNACNNQTQSGESYFNLQARHIDNITTWGAGENVDSLDEELSTKEGREEDP